MSFEGPPAAASGPPARERHSSRRRNPLTPSVWESWDDERLLDLEMCDLDVRIAGSGLEEVIADLRRELRARGLRRFRPHFWLSDDQAKQEFIILLTVQTMHYLHSGRHRLAL